MAEHDIEKIVEAGGEVFNFRDPTKQPVADRVTSIRAASSATDTNYPTEKAVRTELDKKVPIYNEGSEVPSSQDLVCLRIKCPYVSGVNKSQVLLYDITSFADGTIVNNDGAYVTFKGFLIGGKPTGSGDAICVKICAKVAYTQISGSASFRTLKSDSSICGPEIIKRTEDGVDKYYLSIFYESTLFQGNDVLVGSFRWRAPNGISDYSYKNGVIGEYRPNQTYPANEPFWDRLISFTSNVASNTSASADKLSSSRKLKTNLARTADSTFDGSADQTNIPVTGTLPVGSGGTGRTSVTAGNYVVGAGTSALTEKTPKDAGSDVLKSLDTDNGDVVDGDFIVTSYHVNASTISASTFVRRTALNLWNYIKSKLSGSDVNIGGNAATATNATTADTAKAYDPTFSGTNSIASALESKVTEIAFTEGNASAATDLTNVVLCGLKYTGSSLSSGRLSFTLSVTIDRGASSKGGILRVDLAIGPDGSIYCKRASLTARSGGLDISEFRLVTGTNGGKPVVGVVWNGTTTSGAYMDVRVIDYMALSASASFVYDAVLSNVSNVVWGSSNAIQSASDSDVVHISGSETITGAKEFSRSGQETNFTDSSGSESIVRARTSTSSNNGSCQLNADRTTHRFGVYGRNENGTSKWVSFVGNDGVVNLGSYGDEVRIGGTKFVFNASQLGTEANTFYWI